MQWVEKGSGKPALPADDGASKESSSGKKYGVTMPPPDYQASDDKTQVEDEEMAPEAEVSVNFR